MTSPQAAFYRIDPHRSKDAFFALIDDWEGILVSDGYGVYQNWVNARQTCLAHLIHTARGDPDPIVRETAELVLNVQKS